MPLAWMGAVSSLIRLPVSLLTANHFEIYEQSVKSDRGYILRELRILLVR
jgi:hypothetical protein